MEELIANAGIGQVDEVEEREEDPDSPAEMLKKRMGEEEVAKEKPKRRRRSSVFEEHEESQPFERECASYELLPDAPQSVDQLAYWLPHEEHFPILCHLAKIVFAVPAARINIWISLSCYMNLSKLIHEFL